MYNEVRHVNSPAQFSYTCVKLSSLFGSDFSIALATSQFLWRVCVLRCSKKIGPKKLVSFLGELIL
jgi:hypothetical protein